MKNGRLVLQKCFCHALKQGAAAFPFNRETKNLKQRGFIEQFSREHGKMKSTRLMLYFRHVFWTVLGRGAQLESSYNVR